ncbi:9083_t:CDS:2, partial [Acaulospora morrowiae]
LKIIQCENFDFYGSELIEDSKAFKKIRKVKLDCCVGIPAEFMKVLLQRAGENLRDLKVNGLPCFAEILQCCILYCHGLRSIETTMDKQHLDLFIGLLKVCKDLRDISIDDIKYDPLNAPTPANYIIDDDDEYFMNRYSQRNPRSQIIDNTATEEGNEFLDKMAKVVPPYLKTFRFYLDWWFTPKALETFLEGANCENLKTLDFSRCETFSEKHLNVVLKYCGGHLMKLRLCISKNISKEGLSKARKMIRVIEFVDDEEKFCDEYLREIQDREELGDPYLDFDLDPLDRVLEDELGFGSQYDLDLDLGELDVEDSFSDEYSEDSDEESSNDEESDGDYSDDCSDDECSDDDYSIDE